MTAEPIPTSELGHGQNGMAPWDAFADVSEQVPELAFPRSVKVFDQMRTDSQIEALSRALVMPITRYQWMIDRNGAKAAVTKEIAEDFGLPVKGQKRSKLGRSKGRFNHGEHLRHALLAPFYGFMYFEQVVNIDDSGKARLKKLAPRMPGSISEVVVDPSGSLEAIRQHPSSDSRPQVNGLLGVRTTSINSSLINPPYIPVSRLVAYVNQREGANWYGRSILRTAYKNWLIKDRLLRVDALKHERNGMGIPEYEAPPNADQSVVDALAAKAARIRAGQFTGGAVPNGAKLRLVGVEGTLPDTLESIRYHDEQMARMILAMFLQLGHTESGSRSLGQSFVDYFSMTQESIADWYAEITNTYVIEDLIDWNYGPDEPAPRLVYERIHDEELSIVDLALAVEKGLITVDDELETFLRERHNLPELTTPRPKTPAAPNPAIPPAGSTVPQDPAAKPPGASSDSFDVAAGAPTPAASGG